LENIINVSYSARHAEEEYIGVYNNTQPFMTDVQENEQTHVYGSTHAATLLGPGKL
jgi:hypothetical protein